MTRFAKEPPPAFARFEIQDPRGETVLANVVGPEPVAAKKVV
jgi:hypothetical protein